MRRRCLAGGCALRASVGHAASAVLPSRYAARRFATGSGLFTSFENVPFWNLVEKRRSEASRSVLFSIPGQERCEDLITACRAHGDVSRCFYYSNPSKHLALVEFANAQYLQSFMHCVQPFPHDSTKVQVPTRTRMLYMPNALMMKRSSSALAASRQRGGQSCTPECEPTSIVSAEDLLSYRSIDDQIQALYLSHRQTELSVRLRFFLCSVLEEALCGSFLPYARVRPFGSSVSGLGRRDTDLDMNLLLHEPRLKSSSAKERGRPFRYMTKSFAASHDRQLRGQLLKLVSSTISTCLPQMHSVVPIPAAKVPIVKFRHDMSRFECDLSIFFSYGTSPGSLGMAASEMLYIFGEADARFRPMTYAVRFWAQENGITSDTTGPAPNVTNFQLTLLVVHFLQMKRVLPYVRELLVPPEAGFEYEYGENYSFLSDYSKLPPSSNQQSVGELFEEFCHYYSTFDFSTKGITVLSNSLPTKVDKDIAMHIVNPQESALNVSKNVGLKQLRKLQRLCKASADILEATRNPSLCDVLRIQLID